MSMNMIADSAPQNPKRRGCGCLKGCLVGVLGMVVLVVILGTRHDMSFLKEKPTKDQLYGRWMVYYIAPSVQSWINVGDYEARMNLPLGSTFAKMPEEAWIELHADGKVTAHDLPWLLDGIESDYICRRTSGEGRWSLRDQTSGSSLVKWGIEIEIGGVIQSLNCRHDYNGIYLDIPIDYEGFESVLLRKMAH